VFFDKNVANKLVLPCFSYIHSSWFLLCCKVCTLIDIMEDSKEWELQEIVRESDYGYVKNGYVKMDT